METEGLDAEAVHLDVADPLTHTEVILSREPSRQARHLINNAWNWKESETSSSHASAAIDKVTPNGNSRETFETKLLGTVALNSAASPSPP